MVRRSMSRSFSDITRTMIRTTREKVDGVSARSDRRAAEERRTSGYK